ncbi:MAG: cation:proton antiporter [Nitrospirales bacterium]|nr:MnhB domain-containing protein [Nitrospira sp. MA-1]GJL67757.1 MAG: cation:proton antiporter [Nitrospirales bacterium]HNP59318.1 MnhB domain-containing protein [Nitrospirales bacterium]
MKQIHDSIIVQSMSRLLIPLAQLFAFYVLFFGQYGPGGGFVAGVIWTTSMILAFLVFGLKSPQGRLVEKVLHGDGIGLIIFVGVGGLCLIGGGEFLNYANLEIPGLDAPARRYMGILLAQIGVAVDVAVTGISIVLSLAYHDTEQEYDV